MRRIFIDTGALYALADAGDRHHREAVSIARKVERAHLPVFTTDFVVAEAHVLILARLGHVVARRWLARVDIPLERVSVSDFDSGKALIAHIVEQDYSLTDALSMVVLRRNGTNEVFGFDAHFRSAGFHLLQAAEDLR